MIPILYESTETSFNNNGIGSLCDTTSCVVTEERNGTYEIELQYPVGGALFEYLQEGCFIKAKPNEMSDVQIFHIYASSKPINGIVTFFGEHISYELTGIPIEKAEIVSETAAQALNTVLNAALVPHSYLSVSDIETKASTTLSTLSVRAALGGIEGSLLDTYGGEYEFDNFKIKLHKNRGSNTGIIIGYGKNLTDLKQERNISETYTALFPYAKYTPKKDKEAEEEPEEVTVTLSEKIIYSKNITRPKVLIMDFTDKFSEGEEITEETLRQKATEWAKYSGYNTPSVNITVSFVHLWQSPEYAEYALLERVNLCDTVTVNYEKLGVKATAKVIKTVYDVLKEKYTSIELGDAKSNFADSIKQTTQNIENIKTDIKKSETTAAKKITAEIERATALITGQNGGYVVLNPPKNPQEILIMDKPSISEGVNMWRWNGAGLGYSKTGYNGNFTTAITKDGSIVADFITTGTLTADVIKAGTLSDEENNTTFNLSTGELNMTKGKIKLGDKDDDGYYDFEVDDKGNLYVNKGTIGNFTIGKHALKTDDFTLTRTGVYFYDDDKYIGYVGKAVWAEDESANGVNFNLDGYASGSYMAWGVREKKEENYGIRLMYCAKELTHTYEETIEDKYGDTEIVTKTEVFEADTLHVNCDTNFHNYVSHNMWIDPRNGGALAGATINGGDVLGLTVNTTLGSGYKDYTYYIRIVNGLVLVDSLPDGWKRSDFD